MDRAFQWQEQFNCKSVFLLDLGCGCVSPCGWHSPPWLCCSLGCWHPSTVASYYIALVVVGSNSALPFVCCLWGCFSFWYLDHWSCWGIWCLFEQIMGIQSSGEVRQWNKILCINPYTRVWCMIVLNNQCRQYYRYIMKYLFSRMVLVPLIDCIILLQKNVFDCGLQEVISTPVMLVNDSKWWKYLCTQHPHGHGHHHQVQQCGQA